MFSKANEVETIYQCWKGDIMFDVPFPVPTEISLNRGECIIFSKNFSPITLNGYCSKGHDRIPVGLSDTDYFMVANISYSINVKSDTWVRTINLTLYDGNSGEAY